MQRAKHSSRNGLAHDRPGENHPHFEAQASKYNRAHTALSGAATETDRSPAIAGSRKASPPAVLSTSACRAEARRISRSAADKGDGSDASSGAARAAAAAQSQTAIATNGRNAGRAIPHDAAPGARAEKSAIYRRASLISIKGRFFTGCQRPARSVATVFCPVAGGAYSVFGPSPVVPTSPGLRSILSTSPACSSSAWIICRAYSSSITERPSTADSNSL